MKRRIIEQYAREHQEESGEEVAADEAIPETAFYVTIFSASGAAPLRAQVVPSTKVQRVIKAYLRHIGSHSEAGEGLTFVWDGKTLDARATLQEEGIVEDTELIAAHQQVGGGEWRRHFTCEKRDKCAGIQ